MIAVGISIVINNDYGMDTISTFLLEILNYINFPFWMLSLKFNCIILFIIYCIDAEELGIGSLLNAMVMGLMLFFLAPIFELAVVIIPYYSILALFFGPLFLGIVGAIYVSGGMGAASLEALTNILLKKNFRLDLYEFFRWSLSRNRLFIRSADRYRNYHVRSIYWTNNRSNFK